MTDIIVENFVFPEVEMEIIQLINECGYDAYFVGGCIRDILLGKNPKDFDITTSMPYKEMREVFSSRGYSFHLGGANFLTAFINGIEVAQFRRDHNFDNTQTGTIVIPAETIEEDLERRDFTMNAIAYNPISKVIVDPFNGYVDIKNNIIRFVGDPYKRLGEDALRLFRGLRFRCKYDLIFDGDSIEAILSPQIKEHFIRTVAFERIRLELIKIFSDCDKLWKVFNPLISTGLLFYIFPSLKEVKGLPGGRFHPENVLEHCIYCCENISKKYPILRFAGLLHDVGKGPAAKYIEDKGLTFFEHETLGLDLVEFDLKRLRFSQKEFKYIYNLVKYHMRMWTPDMSAKAARKLNTKLKEKGIYYPCLLRLRLADNNANLANKPFPISRIKKMLLKIENVQCENDYNSNKLSVTGGDLMTQLGLVSGPIVGEIIYKIKNAIQNEELRNNRDEILEWVKQQ